MQDKCNVHMGAILLKTTFIIYVYILFQIRMSK
jgi:hypothetical protein